MVVVVVVVAVVVVVIVCSVAIILAMGEHRLSLHLSCTTDVKSQLKRLIGIRILEQCK
jgi:hypothetical protein